jgi:DNA primase catalytic core
VADIKKLKSNLDIVAVITERGVKLVRKGVNWVAPCPFHEDSTPSFSVNPAAQLWHCFGCGKGGDVFTFVMEQEHISFTEAVKKLCKRDIQTKDLEQLNREREQAEQEVAIDRPPQEILDRVVAYGQKALGRSARAQEYLKGRGLWAPELLRALQIGYSSGKLSQALPRDGKLRRQLTRIGILNKKGNEFLFNRIVCPIFDENGVLVNVYGRSLDPESEVPHLYLPGPRRGVFNRVGIRDASTVILTESILDALSLIVLGFSNTTASYGVNGFSSDIRAALIQAKTARVYCAYDSDPAGDHAADQLAHDLAGHGIEVLRVRLPVKDPNDFIKTGGTKETFQELLDQASVIPVAGATPAPLTEAPPAPAQEIAPTQPAESAPPADGASAFEIVLGDRTYRIESPPVKVGRSLGVLLRVSRGERTHVDTLNLYLDLSRSKFVSRAYVAFRGQVPKKVLEEDFFAVLDEVELRAKPAKGLEEPSTPVSSMSSAEREEATRFLNRPDLIDAIIEDITDAGVVGEDDNKLLVYLVATSRKLERPMSLSAISRASGGKSLVLNRILDLMPPEDVMRYTRLSPKALFYEQPGRYKNKILFIEEAIGAKDADLPVRSMQSERRLSNLVTMTDPKTGELKTQETVVEGPLTFMTSSVEPLDYETATRSFEIAIDESPEQTARVVAQQFHEHTLEGTQERLASEAIVTRHRNAQRLLEPLLVVNPYAKQLRFPSGTLRLRREAGKYLSLMDTVALLHQVQRQIRTFTQNGTTYRYVEVEPADVDRANRLMAGCLTRALSDLPGTALTLLLAIRDHVTRQAEERGLDVEAVTFNRREIREWSAWDDHQLRDNLELLAEQEYVEVVTGSFGKRFVYRLSPDHRLIVQAGLSIEEKIRLLGLTPASELKTPSGSDLAGKQATSRRKP